MIELTDKEVEQVEFRLVERGVSLYELRQNLLDHICCAIEQQLEYGKNFSDAFEEAFSAFGNNGLLRIQLETEELLNQKENPMKQTSFISGIIAGALIAVGSYFKIMHWPGANILTMLGMFTLILVFLPSIFINQFKNEFSVPGKISQIAGLFSLSIFFLGGVFKFLHWPGATMLMYAGAGGSLLLYMPLLMYKNTLEKSTVAKNKYVIVIFVLSIAGVIFTSLRGPSKMHLKGYASIDKNIQKQLRNISLRENEFISNASDSLKNVYQKNKMETNKTVAMIDSLKTVLFVYSSGFSFDEAKKISIEEHHNLLSSGGVYEALLNDENKGVYELYDALKPYGIITQHTEDWVAHNFKDKSFVVAYTNLSMLQLQLKQSQLGKY